MKKIPLRETLQFSLIVIGLIFVVISLYLLAFVDVRRPLFMPGSLAVSGIAMIFYSVYHAFGSNNTKALEAVLLSLGITASYNVWVSIVYPAFSVPQEDYSWTALLTLLLLVSMCIVIVLYMLERVSRVGRR